jgi:IclR family acetate operon transcriptional repressor
MAAVKLQQTKTRATSAAKPAKTDQYNSRAVEKALLALDKISQAAEPPTLNDISKVLGLTKASAFRILHTLESIGYLTKSQDGRYSTPKHGSAKVHGRLINEMLRHGTEPLQKLSLVYRETVSLAALFENHIEVIAVVESPQLMRMGNTTGQIIPPHASSLGKAISAFQSPENRDKLIRSYGTWSFTPNTITDEIAIREELVRVHAMGYAEDRGETVVGGHCFGAPVLAPTGLAVGAVSLSMPEMRLSNEEQLRNIVREVKETARLIQAALH